MGLQPCSLVFDGNEGDSIVRTIGMGLHELGGWTLQQERNRTSTDRRIYVTDDLDADEILTLLDDKYAEAILQHTR